LPRPAVQLLLQTLPHLLGVGRLLLFDVGFPVPHQVVQDPRQFVGRRRDRLGRAQTTPLPSQISTQVTLAAHQAPRRQAQGVRRTGFVGGSGGSSVCFFIFFHCPSIDSSTTPIIS